MHTRLAIALMAMTFGCSHSPQNSGGKTEFVIASTTDFHAALGKAEGLAKTIQDLRKQHQERFVYFDSGDLFQGSLEGNLAKGRAVVSLYNILKPDAAAVGNHEFDFGPDVPNRVFPKDGEDPAGNILARASEAQYPWISANAVYKTEQGKAQLCAKPRSCPQARMNALGQRTLFRPRMVFKRNGLTLCAIGATTPQANHIVLPTLLKRVKFEPLRDVVLKEAEKLRKNNRCDFVALVTHAGLVCDRSSGNCQTEGHQAEILKLLRELPQGTLDIVFAGHTHVRAFENIAGTPVVQSGHSAEVVGLTKLSFDANRRRWNAEFHEFISVPEKADVPEVSQVLKPFRDTAAQAKARIVGTSSAGFERNYLSENPLGNLIADALLAAAKETTNADFSLVNAGGIRADLPEGELNFGHVFSVAPFSNSLVVVELKGRELRQLLEISLSGAHGISPFSGLLITRLDVPTNLAGPWDRDLNKDGKKEVWERNLIVDLKDTAGRRIQDGQTYRLATIDYLSHGGDHQLHVYSKVKSSRKTVFEGVWLRDLIVDYLRKHSTIRPENYFSEQQRRIALKPIQ
ncbi:MAG: bifunctional UDP-sugar hydrolase/5'-nucleotidase [Bdellovibrionota bacterium]